MKISLDEQLLEGSPDTYLMGRDASGKVVFLKTYFYDTQAEEAQADLTRVQDAGLGWTLGHVTLMDIKDLEEPS